ncbi:MAG: hypothetical protein PUB21_09650 [Bacteroidales bacterium]|nr:hypothetical protein [Bacteroidales bacterium]
MARDLREMIQILADKGDEVYSKICKVERVDEARRVIDATPIVGGSTIPAVRLQPVENRKEGLIFVPKVGSFVMVTFFDRFDAYMALGTVFEKVLLDMGDIHLELLNPEGDGKKAVITVRNGDREDKKCPTFRMEKEKVTVQNGETSIEMQKDPSSGNNRILLRNGNNPDSPKMEMTNERISFFEGERGMVDVVKLQEIVKKIVDWCNTHKHTVSVDTETGLGDTKTLTSTIDSLQISDFEHDTMRYSAKKKN